MSKDLFGKESRGVSKNISASNSKDKKDLQPLLPNFLNPEKLPNFSNNFPNFGKKSEDHDEKSLNNETKTLTSYDVLSSINNNPIDSINNSASINNSINSIKSNSINKNVQIDDDDFDADDFVETITTTHINKPKSTLFEKFCQDPSVPNQLIDDGRFWLESVCGEKIHHLILNGRWIYINRKKKAGYKGILTTTANGIPLLKLQYNDFSNGGFKDYFDSSKALKAIYQDWKIYNAPAKSNKSNANNKNSSTHKQQFQKSNREAYLKSLAALRDTRIAQQAFDDAKEAAAKKTSLEKNHKLWASLASTGESKYLMRKALAVIQTEVNDFMRYGDGFIMARITNLAGEVKGYQFVPDEGRKKFAYGLEKTGNLIVLGKLAKKPKLIYVVEGLATGLSVRLARPDVPVVCALDVYNILPVVKQLRALGSPRKCKIIILADNDQWKAQEINPKTNKPIGNPGLTIAHKVALKYRCLVASPKFDGLDVSAKPTDFNDLHQIAGVSEVKRQLKLATRANPNLSFAKAYEAEVDRINHLFTGHKLITVNDRYLGSYVDDDGNNKQLIEAIQQHAVTLLRSGMGSGKTEVVRDLTKVENTLTSAYISPRISLCGNAAARLDSEFYLDYKQGITSREELQTVDHLAIVVNSLPMLISQDGVLRHFDIIILDEIEQLLRHLLTKINNKKLVLECFYSLIRRAKYVIVADAHLSNITIDFLSELRPHEKFLGIVNHYQVGKGKEVILYQEAGNVEIAALCELFRGGKVYIAFNCKKRAKAFYELVKAFYKDNPELNQLNILYISSDTNGETNVREFFSNPNQEAFKYDLVISTPALSSGVSIDVEHFSFVGGIFSHTINTPEDCQQALARVRNANVWHVHISDVKQSLPTDEETIASKWNISHPFDQYHLMSRLGVDDSYGFNDPIYEKLCLNVEKNRAFLVNDFLSNFIKELSIAGFEIKYKDNNEIADFAATYFTVTGKKLEKKRYVKDLLEAKDINAIEAQTIAQKGSVTLAEKCSKDKYDIKLAYRLDDQVDDKDLEFFIEKDERGELRKRIGRLEVAMSSNEQLLRRYEQQELAGINLVPDMRLFWTERLLFSKLLVTLGIDDKSLQSIGLVYDKEYVRESRFITWVEENRKELSGIVYVPKSEQLLNDPLRFVSRLLKMLGLKQKRTGRASKGNYVIDTNQLAFIRNIVAKRSLASLVCDDGVDIADNGIDELKAEIFVD
jgi:phage/plasmid primase-like uncharacterized protein